MMTIRVSRHPSDGLQLPATAPTFILVSGWGADQSHWHALAQQLTRVCHIYYVDYFICSPVISESYDVLTNLSLLLGDIERSLEPIVANTNRGALIIGGWSLGGMLALQLVSRRPQMFDAVVTLAANSCFTVHDDWPQAMDNETFTQFYQSFIQQPEKIAHRFCALQAQGEIERKRIAETLWQMAIYRQTFERSDGVNFSSFVHHGAQLLQILTCIDNRHFNAILAVPCLALFADGDALVPIAAATAIEDVFASSALSCHVVIRLENCGHAMAVSQPERVALHIKSFLNAVLTW